MRKIFFAVDPDQIHQDVTHALHHVNIQEHHQIADLVAVLHHTRPAGKPLFQSLYLAAAISYQQSELLMPTCATNTNIFVFMSSSLTNMWHYMACAIFFIQIKYPYVCHILKFIKPLFITLFELESKISI